ncbi:hypothetical protein V6N12_034624 [Hibiscus sabdariffa]|uniref:Uncharacterized protein n=1 Tax=Hibiscus sabdariffa TaxID=183260 RepID=A0ABR2DHQ1_9ROSI
MGRIRIQIHQHINQFQRDPSSPDPTPRSGHAHGPGLLAVWVESSIVGPIQLGVFMNRTVDLGFGFGGAVRFGAGRLLMGAATGFWLRCGLGESRWRSVYSVRGIWQWSIWYGFRRWGIVKGWEGLRLDGSGQDPFGGGEMEVTMSCKFDEEGDIHELR